MPGEIETLWQQGMRWLEAQGATAVEINLPLTKYALPAYYIIAPAEASSNLSRFDGVKYGHRAAKYADLIDMYKKTRAEGFGDEVKRRIMIGAYVLSHGYYDAYYLQAQKVRRMIADDFQNAFNDADVVLVAPVYAAGEPPIEGIDSAALVEGLRARGHRMVRAVGNAAEVAEVLRDLVAEGDMVVCLGAGDITKWAAGLADAIASTRAIKAAE